MTDDTVLRRPRTCRLGLVLGSGAARGWAHIGVIEALRDLGFKPDVIAGCSIGALVGAAYAAGRLDALKQFALSLDTFKIIRYFDVNLGGGGFIAGQNLARLYADLLGEAGIEDLPMPFGVVATDITRGREIWLRDGPLAPSICATTAIPGLVQPVRLRGRWLADGALVNPVPVSLAQADEADLVLAVNLNADVFRAQSLTPPLGIDPADTVPDDSMPWTWLDDLANRLPPNTKRSAGRFMRSMLDPGDRGPQRLEVINNALAIMSDRITKSRAVGEPPDVMLNPPLAHIGVLQFDKAAEAIAIGRRSVMQMREVICEAFGLPMPDGGTSGGSEQDAAAGHHRARVRRDGPGV
ncbi:MAG: patatin-like phospholipase family protein [Alphaproteobacteria bacterium]